MFPFKGVGEKRTPVNQLIQFSSPVIEKSIFGTNVFWSLSIKTSKVLDFSCIWTDKVLLQNTMNMKSVSRLLTTRKTLSVTQKLSLSVLRYNNLKCNSIIIIDNKKLLIDDPYYGTTTVCNRIHYVVTPISVNCKCTYHSCFLVNMGKKLF